MKEGRSANLNTPHHMWLPLVRYKLQFYSEVLFRFTVWLDSLFHANLHILQSLTGPNMRSRRQQLVHLGEAFVQQLQCQFTAWRGYQPVVYNASQMQKTPSTIRSLKMHLLDDFLCQQFIQCTKHSATPNSDNRLVYASEKISTNKIRS